MRRTLLFLGAGLLGLVLTAAPRVVQAEDEASPAAQVAARVRAAFEREDSEALLGLAEPIFPDPWEVADALCSDGARDAARAFAQAMQREEGRRLAAYLEARGDSAPDPEVRAALTRGIDAESAGREEAIQAAQEALAAVAARGDAWERVRVRLQRGLLRRLVGEYEDARAHLEAAAKAAQALGWFEGAASGWLRAGLSAWAVYDADATQRCFEAHLAVERERESPDGQSVAIGNLGSLCAELGSYQRAEAYYARALTLIASLPDPVRTTQQRALLLNLAELAIRRGRFGLAARRLDEAVTLGATSMSVRDRADVQASEGAYAFEVGAYDRAQSVLRSSDNLYGTLLRDESTSETELPALRLARARVRLTLGAALHEMGRHEEALAQFEDAQVAFKRYRALPELGRLLDNVGYIHLRAGRLDEATLALEEAGAILTRVGDRRALLNAKQNLADVLLARGEAARAGMAQREILAEARAAGFDALVADGHGYLARVALAEGKPAEAFEQAVRGDEALRRMLQGLATPQGPRARERNAWLYESALEAALALADAERAAWAMERGRASTLLQVLQGREEVRDAVVPATLLAEERAAEQALARARALAERARRANDLRATRRFAREVEAATERRRAVVDRILRAAPLAGALLHGSIDGVQAIRERLPQQGAYVAYGLTSARVVALVVQRASPARIVDLGARAELESVLEDLAFETSQASVDDALLKQAHGLLLANLDLASGTQELIVAPAGRLAFFPLCALQPGLRLRYVPSATTHGLLARRPAVPGRAILGVGGADYARRPPSLVPLPGSIAEVSTVATRALVGPRANEMELRAALAQEAPWRAVHIACHGVVDSGQPLESALALTRSPHALDDGWLTALEVLRLRVRADLVVLSACETALGHYYRAEGLVGLPTAFLAAGARATLASLWRVDDAATAQLMARFHAHWKPKDEGGGGVPAAEALVRAQADVRAEPKWAHPYFWAGWVLWGHSG